MRICDAKREGVGEVRSHVSSLRYSSGHRWPSACTGYRNTCLAPSQGHHNIDQQPFGSMAKQRRWCGNKGLYKRRGRDGMDKKRDGVIHSEARGIHDVGTTIAQGKTGDHSLGRLPNMNDQYRDNKLQSPEASHTCSFRMTGV